MSFQESFLRVEKLEIFHESLYLFAAGSFILVYLPYIIPEVNGLYSCFFFSSQFFISFFFQQPFFFSCVFMCSRIIQIRSMFYLLKRILFFFILIANIIFWTIRCLLNLSCFLPAMALVWLRCCNATDKERAPFPTSYPQALCQDSIHRILLPSCMSEVQKLYNFQTDILPHLLYLRI